ncbi:MAG TPA: hypothetical protein VF556_07700 [Pyrinomonadaceae bacterium]|jgi:hypothetical protein
MKIEINLIARDEATVSVEGQTATVTIRRFGYDSELDATSVPEDSPAKLILEQFHEPVANVLKILQITNNSELSEPLSEEILDEIWEEVNF